jgi:hypothetical protein
MKLEAARGRAEVAALLDCRVAAGLQAKPLVGTAEPEQPEPGTPTPSRSRSGREPHRAEPLLFGCAPRRHQPAAAPKAGELVPLA